ncbi:MAG: hypothetical protein FWE68_06230 [Defluviitaleaceae bacterium]|nr:hypothetical protein [Defluviitaleaceae bacterium]
MGKEQQPLAMDYVYQDSLTDEFRNIGVKLYPNESGEYFEMELASASKLTLGDLELVLNSLWGELFAKLRVNPVDDCRITLSTAGEVYDVDVERSAKISVMGLTPR